METFPNSGLIRTFVPSLDFTVEKQFYRDLGFKIGYDSKDLCVMHYGDYSFYLQDYYIKEWADNFMMFMELQDVDISYHNIKSMDLTSKYKNVRLTTPVNEDWGRVFRLITPTGVLWHFGEFKKENGNL